MINKQKRECELCGKIRHCSFCRCDACRNVIYDNTPDNPRSRGRWLCKECIKTGGESEEAGT